MAKKNYDELAKLIIENVGGKDNITQVQHCITRLRFQLKDMDKSNTEVLSKTPGVIKVMIASGQYQVVIGNAVSDVYEAVCRLAGVSQSPAVDAKEDDAKEEAKEKKGIGALILEYMSAIIYPVLSLLTAAGILKGLLTIATWGSAAKPACTFCSTQWQMRCFTSCPYSWATTPPRSPA